MNYAELSNLDLDQLSFPYPLQNLRGENGLTIINGQIAIPIESISSVYEATIDIPVHDESDNYLGMLCFCRNLGSVDLNRLTEWQFISFLKDAPIENLQTNEYRFEKDYLVLDYNKYNDYISFYRDTAPLWGKFHHDTETPDCYKVSTHKIIATKNISLPTNFHRENIIRAIKEPFAFERFLKFYHLLELLFDFELVTQIHALSDDMVGIGKILSDYRKDDIARLKSVVVPKCKHADGVQRIGVVMRKIETYADKGRVIFHDFGKDSNPLTLEQYNELVTSQFSYEDFRSPVMNGKVNNENTYFALILNLVIYWIYRMRCCIAHNKIGEYVMTFGDEEFIAEFGEPLLLEVIFQCFKTDR